MSFKIYYKKAAPILETSLLPQASASGTNIRFYDKGDITNGIILRMPNSKWNIERQ